MRPRVPCRSSACALLLVVLTPAARGQDLLPPDPARTIGQVVPFDGFADETGRSFATLQAPPDRPWIVSPIYTRCPHTCSAITSGLQAALAESGLDPSEYRVMSFSFDPAETADGLQAFRSRMRLPPEWLTLRASDATALERTLRSLDFRTIAVGEGMFEHPNLVVVLSSDRRIVAYSFGVRPLGDELVRAVRRARYGVSALDPWRPYLPFFAALGFLISGAVFLLLLARRRAQKGP